MNDEIRPDKRSGDMEAMERDQELVCTLLGGVQTIREKSKKYLPQFPTESDSDYKHRLDNAKLTNIFLDIVENLAQRPFAKKVQIDEEGGVPPQIIDFGDDVDGQGSSLHSFAGEVFFYGIAQGLDWLLVDYTKGVPPTVTVSQERALGARPYFVRIPAQNVLAVYSDMVNGREQFIHARIWEPVTVREGWKEVEKKRVRVFNREPLGFDEQRRPTGYAPAVYEVWELQKDDKQNGKEVWVKIDTGPVTIGEIPLVPFLTGRRRSRSWRYDPPMRAAAELQIELYQEQSGLKHVKDLTAFPMLAANGVQPEKINDKIKPVQVGPKMVLYAPPYGDVPGGSWSWIEPSATTLTFLAEDSKETKRELRELGRQPLTAQSGNLTVITTAYAAQKGNAAIQAWALNLKDALEKALHYVTLWLRLDFKPIVIIDLDFDLGYGDDESFNQVLAMYAAGLISRAAVIKEARKRGILDTDYDGEEDLNKILDEMDEGSEDDGDTGDPDSEVPDGELRNTPPNGAGRPYSARRISHQ